MTKTATKADAKKGLLLRAIDEGFNKDAWHGPNLMGTLRGVKADVAAFRPRPDSHTIVELTAHCAYCKYLVRRRITGQRARTFPLPGSMWFVFPRKLSDAQWREVVSLLVSEQGLLRHAILEMEMDASAWLRRAGKRAETHILGVAMHDIYHAGQIRMIRALRRKKGR